MSYDITNTFNKSNLDTYLKELARLFRKQNGKGAAAEMILVGGAAILVNCNRINRKTQTLPVNAFLF